MNSVRTAVAALISSMVVASMAHAETIRVPGDFPTIQQAIQAATDGDVIDVASGTYVENLTFLGKDISVQGQGFAQTIVDGGGNGSCVTFDGGETSAAVLTGFTLLHGSGTLLHGRLCGGGAFIAKHSAPTLFHNCFLTNTAFFGGGVFADATSNPRLIDNCIAKNHAHHLGAGGGLFALGGGVIDGNLFSENGAIGGAGGGAFLGRSRARVTRNQFDLNFADVGGGLCLQHGAAQVDHNCFQHNTVLGAPNDGSGGGLAVVGASK